MATKTPLVSATAALLLVAVIALSGCTPRPDGPGPAAEKFFRALGVGDTATVAAVIVATGRIASLYVNNFNTVARAAYARVGFAEVGTFATVLLD